MGEAESLCTALPVELRGPQALAEGGERVLEATC